MTKSVRVSILTWMYDMILSLDSNRKNFHVLFIHFYYRRIGLVYTRISVRSCVFISVHLFKCTIRTKHFCIRSSMNHFCDVPFSKSYDEIILQSVESMIKRWNLSDSCLNTIHMEKEWKHSSRKPRRCLVNYTENSDNNLKTQSIQSWRLFESIMSFILVLKHIIPHWRVKTC